MKEQIVEAVRGLSVPYRAVVRGLRWFNPRGYFKNSAVYDGRRYDFTGYRATREDSHACQRSALCPNGAGWHGFRRMKRNDDVYFCTRHWRVVMGYSME